MIMERSINRKYSGTSAASYAIKYATTPNKQYKYFSFNESIGGDCTNFISQCLFAGGAPMVYNKLNPWYYRNGRCSPSWSVAHSLYWYLKRNFKNSLLGPKGLETNNINMLKLGDLIFYENGANQIYHSAIITDLNSNIPLVSQHTYDAVNIPYIKNRPHIKYHFIKVTL